MSLFRTFRRRPLRSSLLLLQVFLGSLVMTLALSAALGNLTPNAPPERFDLIGGYETTDSSQVFSVFYAAGLPELLKLAPDVQQLAIVSPVYEPTVTVGDTRYAFRSVARVSTGFFDLAPLTLVRGTSFTATEFREGQDVAVLSEQAAKALFGDTDPIGQILNLETDDFNPDTPFAPPTPYRIVGTFTPTITSQFSGQPALYLPYGSSGQASAASMLSVRAKPGQGEAARAQLLSAARKLYGDAVKQQGGSEGQDFMIKTPGDESFGPQGIDQDVLVFGLFGVVALVISSIGIFSATIIEAEERAHEIGIRRALGASAARIASSLVLRALSVAVLGSALGIGAAALLIPVFQDSAQTLFLFGGARLVFNPLAAAVVFGTVVVVSGVLGLVPGFRVGRLKPVQALRESV